MSINRAYFRMDDQLVRQIFAADPTQINPILHLKDDNRACEVTPIFLAAIAGQVTTLKILSEKHAIRKRIKGLFNWNLSAYGYDKVWEVVSKQCSNLTSSLQNMTLSQLATSVFSFNFLFSNNNVESDLDLDFIKYSLSLGETATVDCINQHLKDNRDGHVVLGIYFGALANQNHAVLEYLKIDCGFDITATVQDGPLKGYNALGFAALIGYKKIFPLLIEMGFDMNAPLASGQYEGQTPAAFAAAFGELEIFKFLKELGFDMNAPIASGKYKGSTPACVAAGYGQLEVLKYLHANGCELDPPMLDGAFRGAPPVYLAACRGHVEILKFLHEIGVEMNTPLAGGPYKGYTPAYAAARNNSIDCLNTLQELGVDLDVPVMGKVLSNFWGVKKLNQKQRIEIAFRQLNRHQNWFVENEKRFIHDLEAFAIADWVKGRSCEDIRKIYQRYLAVGGQKTRWILDVVTHFINFSIPISKIEMRELIALFDVSNYSLEDFAEATTPGPLLLTLFECLLESQEIHEKSDLNQLYNLAIAVLDQTGGDEEFWQKSQDFFKEMRKKIQLSSNKLTKIRKGRGKGTGKKADRFNSLWIQFTQKIEKSATSKNAFEKVVAIKRKESEATFKQLFNDIELFVESFRRQIEFKDSSNGDDPFEKEYLDAKTHKTEILLNALLEKRSCLIADLEELQKRFGKMDFQRFDNVGNLQEELNAIVSKMIIDGANFLRVFKTEIAALENALEFDLRDLRKVCDFKRAKSLKMNEVKPYSYSQEYKKIILNQFTQEKVIWEESEKLLNEAITIEELELIDRKANKKWADLRESLHFELLRRLEPTISSKQTRDQRIDQHKDEKVQRLKRKKKELIQEIERFRQMPVRARSPEMKLLAFEKPLKERLIKKLQKIAFISENAAKALSMINQEGEILSTMTEIKQFLALFKIEHHRMTESPATFNHEFLAVLHANQTGESKPDQVEEALKIVLDKLDRKK